jgi:hypothetical protein
MIQLYMCKVLVPQHLESGKQPWLLCEKQVLFDLGVRERYYGSRSEFFSQRTSAFMDQMTLP